MYLIEPRTDAFTETWLPGDPVFCLERKAPEVEGGVGCFPQYDAPHRTYLDTIRFKISTGSSTSWKLQHLIAYDRIHKQQTEQSVLDRFRWREHLFQSTSWRLFQAHYFDHETLSDTTRPRHHLSIQSKLPLTKNLRPCSMSRWLRNFSSSKLACTFQNLHGHVKSNVYLSAACPTTNWRSHVVWIRQNLACYKPS